MEERIFLQIFEGSTPLVWGFHVAIEESKATLTPSPLCATCFSLQLHVVTEASAPSLAAFHEVCVDSPPGTLHPLTDSAGAGPSPEPRRRRGPGCSAPRSRASSTGSPIALSFLSYFPYFSFRCTFWEISSSLFYDHSVEFFISFFIALCCFTDTMSSLRL